MIDTNKYDVVIVGAGPVGTTSACLLKALNRDLKICVFDKYAIAKRSHGLKINSDSISKVNAAFDMALKQSENKEHREAIQQLKNTFTEWKNNGFVRTNEIEKNLGLQAQAMGIKIFRGEAYAVTPEFIGRRPEIQIEKDKLVDFEAQAEYQKKRKEMREIFDKANVYIGADGAHSSFRQEYMKNELIEEETFQYLVELKYQTNIEALPQTSKISIKSKVRFGEITLENVGKAKDVETKPVTFRAFVDKETYEALRQPEIDEKGNIKLDANSRVRLKGVFGNSWSMKSLHQEIVKKRQTGQVEVANRMNHVYKMLEYYLRNAQDQNKACFEEQISALELKVFISKHTVKKEGDKIVALVGDASSGMILERGFNLGLMQSVYCAEAVNTYLKNKEIRAKENKGSQELPDEFKRYEEFTHKMFKQEKWWAQFKNFWIETARRILAVLSKYVHSIFKLNPISTVEYD